MCTYHFVNILLLVWQGLYISYIQLYTYIYVYTSIYTYIDIEWHRHRDDIDIHIHIHIYIYILYIIRYNILAFFQSTSQSTWDPHQPTPGIPSALSGGAWLPSWTREFGGVAAAQQQIRTLLISVDQLFYVILVFFFLNGFFNATVLTVLWYCFFWIITKSIFKW